MLLPLPTSNNHPSPARVIQQGIDERNAKLRQQLEPILGETGFARFEKFYHGFPGAATMALMNGRLGEKQLTDLNLSRLRIDEPPADHYPAASKSRSSVIAIQILSP